MEYVDEAKKRVDKFMESDTAKWLVAVRDPMQIWENHRSFLALEYVLYFLALLTLKHALSSGGRYKYLWLTTIFHGLAVECFSYYVPDVDNFWHAQSSLMLLGKRLPLHVVLLYPVFIYTAMVAVSRLRLKSWAEPFAVGLAVVLMDVPFDIMGIKLLFWSWHDTDPNIFDRMYHVPWTSYYFHAAFASSFAMLFRLTRSVFCSSPRFESDGFFKEMFCCLLNGSLAFVFGVLQFIPLYHPLHDMLSIHSIVCVFLFLSLYFLIVWTADRHPDKEARGSGTGWFDSLTLLVVVHFLTYIVLVFTEDPTQIKSTGLHEVVGPCDATTPVQTAFGQVLKKRTYLCASKYDEAYFDFHCVAKPPADKSSWYTICGTGYTNHIEYMIIVTAFSLFGLFVYLQMLAYSGKHVSVGGAKVTAAPQQPQGKRTKRD